MTVQLLIELPRGLGQVLKIGSRVFLAPLSRRQSNLQYGNEQRLFLVRTLVLWSAVVKTLSRQNVGLKLKYFGRIFFM